MALGATRGTSVVAWRQSSVFAMAPLLAPLLFGVAGSSSSEWSSAFQVEGRGSSAVKFVRRSLPSLRLWQSLLPAPCSCCSARV